MRGVRSRRSLPLSLMLGRALRARLYAMYVVGALAMFGDEATVKLHTADSSGSG